MRDLVRRIVESYKSLRLERQEEGYILFSGQDPDSRDLVSIKILPRLLGEDPQIAHRFERLARAIRQLNHPNIASVRKVGQEAGLPYLVTQSLEKAHPLAAKLDQPWAVDAAADLTMQVGQALEHAYRKGVTHGTLTPEKIVLLDDGRVQVTDLGLGELMSLVGAEFADRASPYLSPGRRSGQAVDARDDVYSLAAILYRLLTERPPQVVRDRVLPPSRFNPDVSPGIDQAVVKALSPSPADRYPDVKAFLAALGSSALVASVQKPQPQATGQECPRCGTKNQGGRFCRKCGLRLEQPPPPPSRPPLPEEVVLDEPIQITRVEVGRVEVGHGIEVQDTVIAEPTPVATGEVSAEFPEPLQMPSLDLSDLWPEMGKQQPVAMPEPPEMPNIDWAETPPPMPEVPPMWEVPKHGEEDTEND
ncbi:MAG: protein kinase [Anaerolineae bacterium]|nr:protein kinase [Anaerolineae bacterium]